MLTTNKTIMIEGESVVNDEKIATFRVVINCDNPKNVRFSVIKHNEDSYKINRKNVRADEAEFEDYAYQVQEDLIKNTNE